MCPRITLEPYLRSPRLLDSSHLTRTGILKIDQALCMPCFMMMNAFSLSLDRSIDRGRRGVSLSVCLLCKNDPSQEGRDFVLLAKKPATFQQSRVGLFKNSLLACSNDLKQVPLLCLDVIADIFKSTFANVLVSKSLLITLNLAWQRASKQRALFSRKRTFGSH